MQCGMFVPVPRSTTNSSHSPRSRQPRLQDSNRPLETRPCLVRASLHSCQDSQVCQDLRYGDVVGSELGFVDDQRLLKRRFRFVVIPGPGLIHREIHEGVGYASTCRWRLSPTRPAPVPDSCSPRCRRLSPGGWQPGPKQRGSRMLRSLASGQLNPGRRDRGSAGPGIEPHRHPLIAPAQNRAPRFRHRV